MEKDLESLYEKAVSEESFRREFLNSIDLGEIGECISKLVVRNKQKKDLIMRCVYPPKVTMGIGLTRKSKILIYPLAFDKEVHPNFYDFISTLRDHERYHASEHYYFIISPPKVAFEVGAEENVLKNLSSKNSAEYRKTILERINHYNES